MIMGSILAYPMEAPLLKLFQKCIKKKKKITVHHPTTYLHVYKIVNYSPGIVTKHCSRDEIYMLIQT